MSDKSSDEIARGNLNILIQTAITQERDRIIKLLKDEFCEPEFKGDSFTPADNVLVNLGLAIELIKGENK